MSFFGFTVIEVDAPASTTSSGVSVDIGIWVGRYVLPIQDELSAFRCHLLVFWCQRFVNGGAVMTGISANEPRCQLCVNGTLHPIKCLYD